MSLTRHSRSGKYGRLSHVIGTREMLRGRSLRSINLIWFLTTWFMLGIQAKRLCADFNAGPSKE